MFKSKKKKKRQKDRWKLKERQQLMLTEFAFKNKWLRMILIASKPVLTSLKKASVNASKLRKTATKSSASKRTKSNR